MVQKVSANVWTMENQPDFPGTVHPLLLNRALQEARPVGTWPVSCVKELIAATRVKTFEPDSWILRRGEPVNFLYIVVSGIVEISASSADGSRLTIRYAGPGWSFGLLGLVDGNPMNHSCRAHERTAVALLPKEVLFSILKREPTLWESVAREVAERNRFILRQFAEQAFEPLRVRLARVILILAESYGSECNDGVVVNLRLAKDKLGEMLSVSRQSVTKEIKPLETEGVIRMNYGRILILDMEALRAIARAD